MLDYKERKNVLKEIGNMRNEYQIADYLKENIPDELWESDEFIDELKALNSKFVNVALDLLSGEKHSDLITDEIKEKGIEAAIEKYGIKDIPRTFKEDMYNLAKEHEYSGDYEKAIEEYNWIIEHGIGQIDKFDLRYNNKNNKNRLNNREKTTYYKSKYSYFICKIKNGEALTDEEREDLETLVKEDQENILGLMEPGKLSSMQVFMEYFENIPQTELVDEIRNISKKNSRGHKKPDRPIIKPTEDSEREQRKNEQLEPTKRLEFFAEKYGGIKSCGIAKDNEYAGNILLELGNGTFIIEKFFDKVKVGAGEEEKYEYVPTNNAATYILHKDVQLDIAELVNAPRTFLQDTTKGNKLVARINHTVDTYYDRFDEKMNGVLSSAKINDKDEKENEDLHDDKKENEEIYGDNDDIKNEELHDGNDNIEADESKEEKKENSENGISIEEQRLLLFNKISDLDKEYKERKSKIEEYREKSLSIEKAIEEAKEMLEEDMQKDLSQANISESVEEARSLIESYKADLTKLMELLDETIKSEKENRELRNELYKQFDELMKRVD